MQNLFVFIFLVISSLQVGYSQIFQDDYNNRLDSTLSEGEIFLDLQGSTWFYNNEYFNPYYKGYTLIGAEFQPKLVYQSDPKLQFSLGANFHLYYGDNEKVTAMPMFSVEYKATKNFSVLMGSYNGGENHRLHDAVFSFENHLTDLVENGILIRYDNSRIKSETWLNWESFIEPEDTFREAFTAGSSNLIRLFEISSWKISLPFYLLAHHAGGQINDNDEHVETLINISEGLRMSRSFTPKPLNTVYAEFLLFHSTGDFIPSPGWAFSAKTGLQLTHFELNAEYFKGNDFVSFTGNPLFRSRKATGDPFEPYKYGGMQEMLNFKAGFRQKIGWNSFLFLRFEGYYYTGTRKMDYSYSLHFQVDDFLKLGKVCR
jgi:hypothetical protein